MNGARRTLQQAANARKNNGTRHVAGRFALQPKVHNDMQQFANRLIDLMARPQKVEQSLSTIRRGRVAAPSLEQQQFNQATRSDEELDQSQSAEKLLPGTFVELRKYVKSFVSLVLQSIIGTKSLHQQLSSQRSSTRA